MNVIGPTVAIATAALVLALGWWRRAGSGDASPSGENDARELTRRLEDRLESELSESRTHLETPPTIRSLSAVDTTEDGQLIYVPTVRIDLGTTDAPGLDLIFEFVAGVLETIHPILEDEGARVRRYDVQFTFGPDGLLVSGECRKVSIPPSMATRLLEEDGYRSLELRRDLEAEATADQGEGDDDGPETDDDGGPETDDESGDAVAVLWEDC